jgi:hypothetical protein
LDFGIARTRDSSLTGQGTALGTPAYMSPEQCMGGNVDGRSDLYALGVILYRCVTGRTPFDDPNPLTVMYKHAHAPPPDPRAVAKSELTQGFVACTLKALAKKPDERFVHARAMRLVLEAARDGMWEHGLERLDLSDRDRSVVARRRAAQGAAVSAPGMTRPYGGALDPADAETQALAQVVIQADRGTEEYGLPGSGVGLDASTEPEPASDSIPVAPALSQVLPAGKGVVAEAAALSPPTHRSGQTAEVPVEAAAAPAPSADLPALGAAAPSRRALWMVLAVLLTSALWVVAWRMLADDQPTAEAVAAPPVSTASPPPVAAKAPPEPKPAPVAADAGAQGEADAGALSSTDAGRPDATPPPTPPTPKASKRAHRKVRRVRRVPRPPPPGKPVARPPPPTPPKPPSKPEQPIPLD